MIGVRCAVPARNVLGESPVWDVAEAALYWVDTENATLQRLSPATGVVDRWTLPERISAIALRREGGLVVALASGLALFDPEAGSVERLAAPEAHIPRNRFNDGKCDRRGRFWAGTMDERFSERCGALYRLGGDGVCQKMETGIGVSNGLAWSPDNRAFYFGDTMQRAIFVYDFDLDAGCIGDRRLFADLRDQPGAPDGSTVDSEGFLWNAQWNGWRLMRYAPDGSVDRVVELPVQNPTSCMFGGPDLRTLYVTSALWGLSPADVAGQPWAGALLELDVGVAGLPECRFQG